MSVYSVPQVPQGLHIVPHVRFNNTPNVWQHSLPVVEAYFHKYYRGLCVVEGSPMGATILVAKGALSSGVGVVGVALFDKPFPVHDIPSVIHFQNKRSLHQWVGKTKHTTYVIGPGMQNRNHVIRCLRESNEFETVILDAGALSLLDMSTLCEIRKRLHNHWVLTPHMGEFQHFKLQGEYESLYGKVLTLAKMLNSIVVLKGNNTLIGIYEKDCIPQIGITKINESNLSIAGTGDVLSGLIGGLIARGMPPLQGVLAGVWIHQKAGQLISQIRGSFWDVSSLITMLPDALQQAFLQGTRKEQNAI